MTGKKCIIYYHDYERYFNIEEDDIALTVCTLHVFAMSWGRLESETFQNWLNMLQERVFPGQAFTCSLLRAKPKGSSC